MTRYLVEISYLGTRYVGWQRQPNGLSIQQVIEDSLTKLLRTPISIVGCGRTDAGVHASQYFFHFDTEVKLTDERWYAFKRMLPESIAYLDHKQVDSSIHARYSAVERSYIYRIHTEKHPFLHGLSTEIYRAESYDQEVMRACAQMLRNYTDFTTFCKTGTDVKHKLCTMYHSDWEFEDQVWSYHVSANRFLRGMVRLIVGCCLEIGRGKMKLSDLEGALSSQSALPHPYSAPAVGLYLSSVKYNLSADVASKQ